MKLPHWKVKRWQKIENNLVTVYLLALYTVLLPVPKAACKMLQLEGTLGQPADQPPVKKRK